MWNPWWLGDPSFLGNHHMVKQTKIPWLILCLENVVRLIPFDLPLDLILFSSKCNTYTTHQPAKTTELCLMIFAHPSNCNKKTYQHNIPQIDTSYTPILYKSDLLSGLWPFYGKMLELVHETLSRITLKIRHMWKRGDRICQHIPGFEWNR